MKMKRPSKRMRIWKRSRRVTKRRFSRVKRAGRVSMQRGYGFGDTKVVYCKWVATAALAPQQAQAVLTADTAILVNSAYDPWSGVAGAYNVTAAGFDLHAKIYDRYIVLGAKLVATFRPVVTGASDYPFKVGLRHSDTSAMGSYITWQQCATDPDTITRTMVSTPKSQTRCTVVAYYSPRKQYGIKDARDTSFANGISAAVNANPTKTHYCIPWYQCQYGNLAAVQNWEVEYKLYQKVLFTDRKDMLQLAGADSLIQD